MKEKQYKIVKDRTYNDIRWVTFELGEDVVWIYYQHDSTIELKWWKKKNGEGEEEESEGHVWDDENLFFEVIYDIFNFTNKTKVILEYARHTYEVFGWEDNITYDLITDTLGEMEDNKLINKDGVNIEKTKKFIKEGKKGK